MHESYRPLPDFRPTIAIARFADLSILPRRSTPFFAPSKIGIEVTPLIAFVGTLLTIAAGAGIHHLMKDDDVSAPPAPSAERRISATGTCTLILL